METTAKETQTNEEVLLYFIHDFFDCRKLPQHLLFLDYWMEKVLVNRTHKKYLKTSDLLFFADKFLRLLTACYEITSSLSESQLCFEESIRVPEDFIGKEQKLLKYYPNYLRTKEVCNPILVLKSIFKTYPIDYYTFTLQNWLNEGLCENAKLIFPTYKNLKRMIEACWLIHERSISKNSYLLASTPITNTDFPLSCPLLLSEEYMSNPYLQVESFFSFASINEYRDDLTQWFKAAINEDQCCENASDILFIHNQFTQLIHAAYLIGTASLAYQPEHNYTKQHDTFGHWLLAKMDNQYSINTLSPHFKENPLQYFKEQLTLSHVIKLRYGLKEWLETAISKSTSITGSAYPYIFDQFEDLQKVLEASFLLIVKPALAD